MFLDNKVVFFIFIMFFCVLLRFVFLEFEEIIMYLILNNREIFDVLFFNNCWVNLYNNLFMICC